MGQFQIVLVFISSFVLIVKDMPEQRRDGAGDLWKGPGFAGFMVLIGLMTLLMTAYTLIVDSALIQGMFARWSRRRRRNRVKPAEAPAPAPAQAPGVAEASVPAASTVEAEAPTAPDKQGAVADASRAPPSLGVSPSGRPRTVVRRGKPRDPGGSLRVPAMVQRAVARPLHAGPPSRRPPPLQSRPPPP